MTFICSMNEKLNCSILRTNDGTEYLVDHDDKEKIARSRKYKFDGDITFIDFIYNEHKDNVIYKFVNNDNKDLRKWNVLIYHESFNKVAETYEITEYIEGHIFKKGKYANMIKNPIYKVKDIIDGKDLIIMYCEKDGLCKLDGQSYNKILEYEKSIGHKITWHVGTNGYVQGSEHNTTKEKKHLIHQIIMDCYGNGKGTLNISVDHIDRNPLNNMMDNLRVVGREEQEQNSKGVMIGTKKERQKGAKQLPNEISQEMMKKYVVYYHEYLNKERTREREFFRVEDPKLINPWSSSKSNKVSIIEKLEAANKVATDLTNNIYPMPIIRQLPRYFYIAGQKGRNPALVFEKKMEDGKRYSIKMTLPDEDENNYDMEEQIEKMIEKIKEKYADEVVVIEN